MNSNNASRWDLGRFVQTLAYFGVVPVLSQFDWFQAWFGSRPHPTAKGVTISPGQASSLEAAQSVSDPESSRVILVTGATGGVGKRVVRRLLARGYKVRALVRDPERARSLLGESVELAVADITRPETLTPGLFQQVQRVISCTGVRVQPKEGDTPDRAKYYQGVQFYEPEVVGDTPEAVEYQGIKNLVQALEQHCTPAPALQTTSIFDFGSEQTLQETWGAVDDVVMGGVSESGLRLEQGVALFTGTVSTANSGGFASVRTRNFEPALDLSADEGIELHLRGDGKRYKFMVRTETKWDGVAYCYSLDTEPDTWMRVRIPFSDFTPVFRAKTAKEAGSLDPSQICAFQLMLSKFEYDGALNPRFEPGAFKLAISAIQTYQGSQLPQLVLVSSAGVTRPGRPDLVLEQEPPAVRMNDQLGGILTWKLRGEAAVRDSGLAYTIIRPCALTEAGDNSPLVVDQGDQPKGQVSREAIAELCIQALEHPQARNVTFEVAEGPGECSLGDWACLFTQLNPDQR